MSQTIKVLLPINPSENDEKIEKNLFNFLRNLSETADISIEPVSVMSSNFFTTSEYFEPIDTAVLKMHLRKDCEAFVAKNPDLPWGEIKLLENNYASQSAEVQVFDDYVQESGADFVVMSSHGRSGWSRAFMGSFTESFLLKSRVPVFVLGPKYIQHDKLSSALMPVELSETSQRFLEIFLDHHALSFVEQLKLYHKVSMVDLEDIAWAPSLYGLGGIGSGEILNKADQTANEYLKSFMNHPLSEKRLSYEVSTRLDALSEVICERAAEEDIDLLVMRSESGLLSANILGSVSRQVIREAEVPVVVYPFTCQKIK